MTTWLVTGGLGFIGSTFVRAALCDRSDIRILNFDAMTYAGNPANLADIEDDSRYLFNRGNICDADAVGRAIAEAGHVDAVINFAAETHVDRSILDPDAFLRTAIFGTQVLLEAVRRHGIARFVQVSTDEVYGHVPNGKSKESDSLAPRSPYAASKAGADLQVLAHANTYGTPVVITRGSNTYGPRQYPEKLIPLFVTNLIDDAKVPVYGDGLQIRDWLHAEDHAAGIMCVLERGEIGHVYNVGADNGMTNLEITRRILELCGRKYSTHVEHVIDRPGHDRRYALDSSKTRALGWAPKHRFEDAIATTVSWYRENESWWRPIKSGSFADYYRRQYVERGTH